MTELFALVSQDDGVLAIADTKEKAEKARRFASRMGLAHGWECRVESMPLNRICSIEDEWLDIDKVEAGPAVFTCELTPEGPRAMRELYSGTGLKAGECSEPEWRHEIVWKDPNYGSYFVGSINQIAAEDEEQALEIAKKVCRETVGRHPAFFIGRFGVFYEGAKNIVRASQEIFGSEDEARFYAKNQVPGFGIDPAVQVLSFAEAGRRMAKKIEQERIRERNIKMLANHAHIPVLSGIANTAIADTSEDCEHW